MESKVSARDQLELICYDRHLILLEWLSLISRSLFTLPTLPRLDFNFHIDARASLLPPLLNCNLQSRLQRLGEMWKVCPEEEKVGLIFNLGLRMCTLGV